MIGHLSNSGGQFDFFKQHGLLSTVNLVLRLVINNFGSFVPKVNDLLKLFRGIFRLFEEIVPRFDRCLLEENNDTLGATFTVLLDKLIDHYSVSVNIKRKVVLHSSLSLSPQHSRRNTHTSTPANACLRVLWW